jgi:DmsE family decaheme c-type cytochrome
MAIFALIGFATVAQAKGNNTVHANEALNADKACTVCHNETWKYPVLNIYQTPHGVRGDARSPRCQTCHGDSQKHIADAMTPPDIVFGDRVTTKGIKARQMLFSPSDPEKQSQQCKSCHEDGLRTHWEGSQHQTKDLACSSCHSVHQKKDPIMVRATQKEVCFDCHKEQRADTHKMSTHPLDAGKITCSDCHNPHGSAGPKLLKKNTLNETCWQCHADKRGPFLWEHQPANEDCGNCHTPHGSNIGSLLKNRAPYLCDDCHDGPHNSQAPYGRGAAGPQGGLRAPASASAPANAPNSSASGRACMNCHAMVHGTNSPTGAFLHR